MSHLSEAESQILPLRRLDCCLKAQHQLLHQAVSMPFLTNIPQQGLHDGLQNAALTLSDALVRCHMHQALQSSFHGLADLLHPFLRYCLSCARQSLQAWISRRVTWKWALGRLASALRLEKMSGSRL